MKMFNESSISRNNDREWGKKAISQSSEFSIENVMHNLKLDSLIIFHGQRSYFGWILTQQMWWKWLNKCKPTNPLVHTHSNDCSNRQNSHTLCSCVWLFSRFSISVIVVAFVVIEDGGLHLDINRINSWFECMGQCFFLLYRTYSHSTRFGHRLFCSSPHFSNFSLVAFVARLCSFRILSLAAQFNF